MLRLELVSGPAVACLHQAVGDERADARPSASLRHLESARRLRHRELRDRGARRGDQLHHDPDILGQPGDPRAQGVVEGRERPSRVRDDMARELDREQRDAGRLDGGAVHARGIQLGRGGLDQRGTRGDVERTEPERGRRGVGERPYQLRTGILVAERGDDQRRERRAQQLDEERRTVIVGPVEIVEHDRESTSARDLGQQSRQRTCRAAALLGGIPRRGGRDLRDVACERRKHRGQIGRVGRRDAELFTRHEASDLVDDLVEGLERDLGVLIRAPGQHQHVRGACLGREARQQR